MARIIRENDIDIDAIRERVGPQNVEMARNNVAETIVLLAACQRLTAPTHEVLRALNMVRDALIDVMEME